MLHKEGYRILLTFLVLLIIVNLAAGKYIGLEWVQWLVLAASIIFYVLILQFFRNPKRQGDSSDGQIVAPVDGKVVVIEEVMEDEVLQRKCRQISIFMSPLNVHVTRYPLGGEVTFSKYHPGKYLVAWHPKASTENERTTVVVKHHSIGEILYRQIAGAMARRIVNYAKEGETVEKGADSGFIKFGSRVDVFIPLDMKVKVELDQKVRGGETVLAELTD